MANRVAGHVVAAIPLPVALAIWAVAFVAIAGVLARPFGIPEWMWAVGGAAVVAFARLLPIDRVGRAIAEGSDVYLFLAGMMLLAELARRCGVFEWVAGRAVRASGGSRGRLFALVYGVGVVVTTVLSNDATAVVLTPAVAAAVRAAKVTPLPYLFACALIANAASFVLPISNPANLVVFAHDMPPLAAWIASFALPSLCSIAITYVVMLFVFRRELAGSVRDDVDVKPLELAGVVTLAGIGVTAVALVVASTFGANLGYVTAICGALVYAIVTSIDRTNARAMITVSWSVLLLVAGLFVLVAAVEETGLLALTKAFARTASAWPPPLAVLAAAFSTGVGSNFINNLPAGLIAGATVAGTDVTEAFKSAVAIGIDLGPNLSVTGSLATILWLLALRREKIEVSGWKFLRVGAVAMPLALAAAVESLLLAR